MKGEDQAPAEPLASGGLRRAASRVHRSCKAGAELERTEEMASPLLLSASGSFDEEAP